MSNQPMIGTGASPNTGAPIMAPRPVGADRGSAWWGEAWRLFPPAVGAWLLITIVLIVLNVVLTFIPLVGHLAGQVLFPVFTGGLMLGCRAIDRGEALTVGHLFAGFSTRTGPLLVVGGIYCALAIGIALVVFGFLLVFFGAAIVSQLWHLQDLQDPMALIPVFRNMALAVLAGALVFLLLYLPLLMAVWFAPALVVLRNIEPLEAMRLSFHGCLRNVVPFLVYGLIGLLFAFVASIPLMLGWFVLGPVTIATIYTSYCDIYEDRAPAMPVTPSPVA